MVSSVTEVYRSVIEDVINNVRQEFVNEANEDVLQQLQTVSEMIIDSNCSQPTTFLDKHNSVGYIYVLSSVQWFIFFLYHYTVISFSMFLFEYVLILSSTLYRCGRRNWCNLEPLGYLITIISTITTIPIIIITIPPQAVIIQHPRPHKTPLTLTSNHYSLLEEIISHCLLHLLYRISLLPPQQRQILLVLLIIVGVIQVFYRSW